MAQDQTATPAPMPDISNDAARDAWLKGEPVSADQPADAAPATPVDQATSTDVQTKPDSEPGDPAKPKGKGVKERNAELDAEIAELNEKLRLRREIRRELDATDRAQPKPDVKPDSSPAVDKKAEAARFRAMPDAPKLEDFESYDDWAIEMASFVADKKLEERDRRSQQEATARQEEQRFTEKVTKASERFKGYLEKHPEAKDRIRPELLAIVPISQLRPSETPGPHNFIAEQIFESDFTGELVDHFSTDAGVQDFQRLMRLSPDAIVREIGRIEARFMDSGTKTTPVRAPKTISTAPDPAETLGRRPAAPADRLEAALHTGDFSAYADEANRRDWARNNP
jgi:hypothetical protein